MGSIVTPKAELGLFTSEPMIAPQGRVASSPRASTQVSVGQPERPAVASSGRRRRPATKMITSVNRVISESDTIRPTR
jgi:hypothetical protein